MSRFHEYNNEFDEEDDGEDLEITDEEEAASDDEGREQAALLMAHCESIAGNRKVHEDQRRMWFRMAKQALAEGAERREVAEAEERAEREQEEAAERARVKAERAAKHDRELIERADRDAAIRRQNAESARIEAEAAWMAAQARPVARQMNAAPPMHPRGRLDEPPLAAPPRPIRQPTAEAGYPPPPAGPRSPHRPAHANARPTSAPTNASRPVLAPVPGPAFPHQRQVAPPRPLPSAPAAPPRLSRPMPTRSLSPKSSPEPATTRRPPVCEVVTTRASPAVPHHAPLAGADLVRWRTQRAITQRAAAEELGVAPSTVAKAELAPSRPLGEQLQVALRARLVG